MPDEQPRNPDADLEMHVAVNTEITAANMRDMGFEEAADTLGRTAHDVAAKASRDGWVAPPPEEYPQNSPRPEDIQDPEYEASHYIGTGDFRVPEIIPDD